MLRCLAGDPDPASEFIDALQCRGEDPLLVFGPGVLQPRLLTRSTYVQCGCAVME